MGNPVTVQSWPVEHEALRGLVAKVEQDSIPHAMLFLGSQETTSTFVAYFVSVLLCESATKPCGLCASCKEIASGANPDLLMLDATESGRVKTSDIEQLQEWLAVRPHHVGKKVYVIHGMDKATPVAANRLLKTLEEPNRTVIAILTATHASLVLPTIQSRCFQYSLRTSDEHLWEDVSTGTAITAAMGSENSTFAAFLAGMVQWTEAWLIQRSPALVQAEDWVKLSSGMNPSDALNILSTWFRDMMHVSIRETEQIRFKKYEPQLRHLAPHLNVSGWAEAIAYVLQTKTRFEAHVALLLNIEQMCIRLQEVAHDV